MTEVPEHLLSRSRERRAALGQGGGDAPAPAAASSGSDAGGGTAAATPAVVVAAAAPVVVEAAPPPPPPPYVQAALDRKKPPKYMGPVGVAILLWAFIYAGVMFASDEISDPVLAEGADIYAAQCSGCHGGSGQGGTGRPLNDLLETFPDPADHIAWVTNGSPAPGIVYGANGHVSQDGWPAMPGFSNALSEEEILAVVRYEREVINGETDSPLASGGASAEGGEEGGAAGGEEAGGDTADAPASEAETEGGDVGGDPAEEETLDEGNETATDDDTPDDAGTGAEGETSTGE